MGSVLTRTLLLALCASVAACTAPAPGALRISPGELVGGYEITGASVPRVLQAFHDDRATYIQFAGTLPAALTVHVGQAGTLAYQVRDRYVVVPGVLTDLQLVSTQGVVRVRRAPDAVVAPLTRAPAGQTWQPDSNADWSREDATPADAMPAPPGAPVAAPRAQPLPR